MKINLARVLLITLACAVFSQAGAPASPNAGQQEPTPTPQNAPAGRFIWVNYQNDCIAPNGNRNCLFGFGGPYRTITDAVDAANPGDILAVHFGPYPEHLTINRSLTILAIDGGIVTIGR